MFHSTPRQSVTIVTGAAGDLGRGICASLLEAKTTVVAVDIDTSALQRLFEAHSENLQLVTADCTDEDSVDSYVHQTIETHGRVDALCNNVGGEGSGQSIADTSLQEFERVMSLNVRSAFLNSRAAASAMAAQHHGAIVNVASISGLVGSANDSP